MDKIIRDTFNRSDIGNNLSYYEVRNYIEFLEEFFDKLDIQYIGKEAGIGQFSDFSCTGIGPDRAKELIHQARQEWHDFDGSE